jgi:hypothetical protein
MQSVERFTLSDDILNINSAIEVGYLNGKFVKLFCLNKQLQSLLFTLKIIGK